MTLPHPVRSRWSPGPLRPTAFANEPKHMMHLLGCWDHDQSNTHHDDTALLSEERVIKVFGRAPWTERYVSGGGVRREKISYTCRRTTMRESVHQITHFLWRRNSLVKIDSQFPHPSFTIYRRPRYLEFTEESFAPHLMSREPSKTRTVGRLGPQVIGER